MKMFVTAKRGEVKGFWFLFFSQLFTTKCSLIFTINHTPTQHSEVLGLR